MNVPAQTVQFEITDLQPTFLDYIQSQKDENTRTFNIQFLFEGDVLSLSGCTATATVTINNIMVDQELACEVNETNNYVTVVVNAPYSGVMAVQVTLASGNDILTMPRPLYIRVTQDIAETAQIGDNSHGSFAEIVTEVANARGEYATLAQAIAAKLDNADGSVKENNIADESITIEKVADDLAAVINAKMDADDAITDYVQLSNKPTINNVELSGNKTLAALGINAGSVGFDETETYAAGSIGAEVSAQKNAIENLEAIPHSVKLAMDTLFSKAAYADDDAASSYATFHAWAILNLVTSITAVFTQGSAVIHDTDSLNTLKRYLTVTATYSDSTTATVTDYTLSGTLTEGTSTITVSYGGKTTTFSVTVTEDDWYSVEYQGNFTTASPSNTRVTLITNDVTLSEGEKVTLSVPSGYKIFPLQSYATGGNSAIDRTAKDVNQIYVNCVSFSGYTVPKDTFVCGSNLAIILFDKINWETEVVYTRASGTVTVSGIGFFVQKYFNEKAIELSIAEAKSVVSIAYA